MAEITLKLNGNSTLVGTMVPVGSRNEPDNIKGISHFLEHSLFKGTKNRDKNQIKRELEEYGAEFNAWTSEEHTLYYAVIANQYADVARKLIDDMVENSIFPEEEIEKEKQVVLQELEMYIDQPSSYIFELAQREIFTEQSGLHIPIIGTRESVKNITREDLVKYYQEKYTNPIKLTVGGVKTEAKNRVYLNKQFELENREYNAEDKVVTRKGINQANMVLTGSFYLNNLREQYMLSLFGAIMNGFSGRFFDVIREQHNLVYHTSFYYQIHSCGTVQYWGYAGLTPDKVILAKQLMEEQLTKEITKVEFDFAKKKLIGQSRLSLDSKESIVRLLIDSIMLGRDYNVMLNNYESIINTITLQDINTFAKKLVEKQPKLVALVPEK